MYIIHIIYNLHIVIITLTYLCMQIDKVRVWVFYYEKPKRNNISFFERSFPFAAPHNFCDGHIATAAAATTTATVFYIVYIHKGNPRSYLMTVVRGFSSLYRQNPNSFLLYSLGINCGVGAS